MLSIGGKGYSATRLDSVTSLYRYRTESNSLLCADGAVKNLLIALFTAGVQRVFRTEVPKTIQYVNVSFARK